MIVIKVTKKTEKKNIMQERIKKGNISFLAGKTQKNISQDQGV